MGLIFSRWRKKKTSEEILQGLQEEIDTLESMLQHNQQLHKKFIGKLVLYSVLLYIVAAIIFYLKYFPTNFKDKIIRSLPLLIFPLIIYGIKRLLHYIFVSRISKNVLFANFLLKLKNLILHNYSRLDNIRDLDAQKLDELKEKKKAALEEVMEKETYKTAKELLDKYDPDSQIVKDNKKDLQTAQSGQSPTFVAGQSTELRRRNVANTASNFGSVEASPSGRLQKAVSVPSLSDSPIPSPQRRVMSPGPGIARPNTPQRANSMSNIDASSTPTPIPHGAVLRPPGPPTPSFPVLPRERSTMDKVVEYLVGDGPSNRYALICKQCLSHNGMALKEDFEYVAFRCCYCYFLNPARKQRPTAPRLEDDPMTPGQSRKNPKANNHAKQVTVKREITTSEEEETDDNKEMTNIGKIIKKEPGDGVASSAISEEAASEE